MYSRPAAIDQIWIDFDAPGHIDTALLERIGVSQGSDFYLCGPSCFLQNMCDGLLGGITPGMAQVDHTPHLPQGSPGSGRPISFARSGIAAANLGVTEDFRVHIAVAWDPKLASLLELAEACDVTVRSSCRTGVCHTCMTGLIAGSIIDNPEPPERPASGSVLVCSRPNADVSLDL